MKNLIRYLTRLEIDPEYQPLMRELYYVLADVWGTLVRLLTRPRGLGKIAFFAVIIFLHYCNTFHAFNWWLESPR